MNIQNTISNVMIEFESRGEVISKVQKELNCTRNKAKVLLYSYLMQADEEFLQRKYSEENWGV